MKYNKIVEMSKNELLEKLKDESEKLRKLKFSHAISPIENPLLIKQTRHTIAKIKTCLSLKHQLKKI